MKLQGRLNEKLIKEDETHQTNETHQIKCVFLILRMKLKNSCFYYTSHQKQTSSTPLREVVRATTQLPLLLKMYTKQIAKRENNELHSYKLHVT